MTKPKLAIIIPTVNASAELDLALTSLAQNSDETHECLVIVDPDQKTLKQSAAVLAVCKKHHLKPYKNPKNLGPYGSWNRGAELSHADYLVFATDDQYFAPHWDRELLKQHRPKRLVAGRLVEPGIIPVYPTNIHHDFGVTPAEFDREGFLSWVAARPAKGFVKGGFFIPLLISRADFRALGPYPTVGTFGTRSAVSNDYNYIAQAEQKGYEFGTADASLSYHFQGSSWKKKTAKPIISAVVLTWNNAKTITACLDSLSWVSELHVVDAFSTDNTPALAKAAKAIVHQRHFDDFATQRNYGLSLVAHADWVFMLDADEVCSPALATELASAAKDIYLDGVNVPRQNYIWGKWIEHADWYPDYRLVFFRPKTVSFVSGVHERATFTRSNGATIDATAPIIHYNYTTVSEFVRKNLLEYPHAYAAELHRQGVTFNASRMLTTSVGEFMRRYFLTAGYKDGLHGFLLSLLMGVQQLLSYIYLWELEGKSTEFSLPDFRLARKALRQKAPELSYWLHSTTIDQTRGASRVLARLKRKAVKVLHQL